MPSTEKGIPDKDEETFGLFGVLGRVSLVTGLFVCLVTLIQFFGGEVTSGFDQDDDGFSLWEEWQHGTSIWEANEAPTSLAGVLDDDEAPTSLVWNPGDADADGIPDSLEQRGPWPGDQYPPAGQWVDVIVEAVVVTTPGSTKPSIVQPVLAEAARVLESAGIALTYGTTEIVDETGLAEEPFYPRNQSTLASAQGWAEWSHDPHVRQVFFVPSIGAEALYQGDHQVQPWGGVALGSTMFLDYGDAEEIGGAAGRQWLARSVIHELGHTLGLCHGHEPACFQTYPTDEQAAVRKSLMSYSKPSWSPSVSDDVYYGLSPSQVNEMVDSVPCLSSLQDSEAPEAVWKAKVTANPCREKPEAPEEPEDPMEQVGAGLSFSERLEALGWTGRVAKNFEAGLWMAGAGVAGIVVGNESRRKPL